MMNQPGRRRRRVVLDTDDEVSIANEEVGKRPKVEQAPSGELAQQEPVDLGVMQLG